MPKPLCWQESFCRLSQAMPQKRTQPIHHQSTCFRFNRHLLISSSQGSASCYQSSHKTIEHSPCFQTLMQQNEELNNHEALCGTWTAQQLGQIAVGCPQHTGATALHLNHTKVLTHVTLCPWRPCSQAREETAASVHVGSCGMLLASRDALQADMRMQCKNTCGACKGPVDTCMRCYVHW